MPIRGSPNGAHHPRPQVVAITRNRWSRSIGMTEGSNRARITSIAAGSARGRLEAGLNEAASCWAGVYGDSSRASAD
jgi:hypothetical protein